MFVVHDDMTIYATRGDVVYFPVEKKQGDAKYQFQPGDVVRIKVCEKKNYAKVFLLKDFVVEEATTSVNIFLDKWEMKFGEVISKPTDYWWEAELNPDTYPDTFIGHDENGPAIFKLFPEAKDVVEGEIPNPEENGAVSRMVVHFVNEYLGDRADTIIQEILKEEYLDIIVNEIKNEDNIDSIIQEILKENNVETIVQEIIKQESLETIVQEIVKTEHVETIVQEVVKPGNVETIVQEIIKKEHLETIVQEIAKPEHIQTIVEQVKEEIPGLLVVTLGNEYASHSASEILAHIDNGGTAILEFGSPVQGHAYLKYVNRNAPALAFTFVELFSDSVHETWYNIDDAKNFAETTERYALGGGSNLLIVTLDKPNGTADHNAAEIISHVESGGIVLLKNPADVDNPGSVEAGYISLSGIVSDFVMFKGVEVFDERVDQYLYTVMMDGSFHLEETSVKIGSGGGTTGKPIANIEVTENADGSITIENTFADGSFETITLAAGEKPDSIDYNGVAIPIGWKVET